MRFPRRRQPRRTHRWEGCVLEVAGGVFSAELVAVDHEAPDLLADFDVTLLPGAEVGVVFTAYVHRRGRRVRTVLRGRRPAPWTVAEVKVARDRARQVVGWLDAP